MSAWELPTSVIVGSKEYAIRSDFRAVLDALAVFEDSELSAVQQAVAFLQIMYPDWQQLPDFESAYHAAMVFVNCGKDYVGQNLHRPQLVSWQQDAPLIAPAVDKVLGFSCRRCKYLHWWEFIGAFQLIGRGTFADVVSIRAKRAKGKKLDKTEQEFARENADLIRIRAPETVEDRAEKERLLALLGS